MLCHAVLCFLFRTYLRTYARTCMRHPGCFPGAWRSWHLQVACLHLICWTTYICHSVPFLLVSERSGRNRNRPRREAPCIYILTDGHAGRHTIRQTIRQTHRYTDGQTDRRKDKLTNGQTYRPTDKDKRADGQTYRQTRQKDMQTD